MSNPYTYVPHHEPATNAGTTTTTIPNSTSAAYARVNESAKEADAAYRAAQLKIRDLRRVISVNGNLAERNVRAVHSGLKVRH